MPYNVMNMIVDVSSAAMPGSGAGYLGRGNRYVDFSDVQYARLCFRGSITSGTVASRIDWSPFDDGVNFTNLIPLTATVGATATLRVGQWEPIDDHDVGDIWIRTVLIGTPSATFTFDWAQLQYR